MNLIRRILHTDCSTPSRALLSATVAVLFLTLNALPSMSQGLYGNMAPRAGQKAPDFQSKSLDGKKIQLSEFRGKPVLLIFWATWCGPCRQRIPGEIALRSQFSEDELAMIAVNEDDRESTVRSFVDSNDVNFTVVWDQNSKIAMQYSVNSYPTMYILDRDGIIINEDTLMLPATIDATVEALVKEGTDAAKAVIKRAEEESEFLDEASKLQQWGDYAGYRDKLVEFLQKFPESTWADRVKEVVDNLNQHLGDEPETADPAVKTVSVGQRVGELDIEPDSGKPLEIADPPGRPVAFVYWSTDNSRSLEDEAELRKQKDSLSKTDLLLVSVNLDSDENKVSDYLKKNDIPYPLVRDPRRFDARLARLFGVKQVPSSALIAPDGKLIATDLYGERLQKGIDLLLAEKNDELLALYHQDQEERSLIALSQDAWKSGDKDRFYQLLQMFTEKYPDSPYTPKIQKVLERNADEVKQRTGMRSFRRGDPVPDFAVEGKDGGQITLGQFTGRPLVLAFLAPWDIASRSMARELANLRKQYSPEDLEVLAIELVSDSTGVGTVFDLSSLGFPVATESSRDDDSLTLRYGVQSVPDLFLIDRKGNLLARHLDGPLLEHAAKLAVEGKTDDLNEFLARAAEANKMLGDAEIALREYGPEVYVDKLRAFLDKYPDHHLAREIGRIVSEHSDDADLSEYEQLVSKSRGIRQAQKDFKILMWAMSEYRANYGNYPEDLDRLVGEDEGLKERLKDPFGDGYYRYGTDGENYWIIVSNGPDGDRDVDEVQYSGDENAIVSHEFNPDQGTEGDGDIFIAGK